MNEENKNKNNTKSLHSAYAVIGGICLLTVFLFMKNIGNISEWESKRLLLQQDVEQSILAFEQIYRAHNVFEQIHDSNGILDISKYQKKMQTLFALDKASPVDIRFGIGENGKFIFNTAQIDSRDPVNQNNLAASKILNAANKGTKYIEFMLSGHHVFAFVQESYKILFGSGVFISS